MAKVKKPTKTVSIRLSLKLFDDLEELLDRKPELGADKTEYIRRLIEKDLKKHQPRG
jgi:predicted DNA-binding protein